MAAEVMHVGDITSKHIIVIRYGLDDRFVVQE
jgi:hypothetical protein